MDPNTPQSNIEGPALGFPRSDISDTLPAPKKSPSQTPDSPFENTNIRDLFRKIDVGGENFLECAECHKLLSTTTSTTNLRKHFKIYHQDRGINTIIAPLEDKELVILNYILECNIPFNTLRKGSFRKIMECMDAAINEERLIELIALEAAHLREKVFNKLTIDVPCSIQLDGWTNIRGEHLYAFFFRTSEGVARYIQQEKADSHTIQGAKWLSSRLFVVIDKLKSTGRICYSITSDNAHVISSAVIELNNRASPKILHHMCGCHCVNLLLGKVIQEFKLMDQVQQLKEKVDEHKRDEGYIKVKKYTPTRWYSLGEHLESLLANACIFEIRYQSVLKEFQGLLKYFYTLLHKLEKEGATLVTAYESFIAFEEALERDKSDLSSYTLDLYLGTYFPNYIDKSCCISMAAFLTPRWKEHIIKAYGDIRGVIKEIHERSETWGIPVPLTSLRRYQSGEEPFVFDPKHEDQPMEQWEIVGMYSDSVHASNLCKFYRILTSISPTEAVVERAFSIEKFIHSSLRNRLSDGRVEDLMALKLNYDVWRRGHRL